MKKQIFTDKEGKKFLKSIYQCTNVMVWKALTFDSHSELARKMRKTLYEHQGVTGFVGLEPPMLVTNISGTDTNQIISEFGFGVSVVYDKDLEIATPITDGEVKDVLDTTDIEEYMGFVAAASKTAWQRYLRHFL